MELEHAENLLRDERGGFVALYEEVAESRERDQSQQDSEGTLSPTVQHPGDDASPTLERERDESIEKRIEYDIAEIDHALDRIRDGVYGRCERCGGQISDERLEILPATRYCLQDAPGQNGSQRVGELETEITQELDQV